MEFSDVIQNRHATRKYSKKKVEEEKLNSILNFSQFAPTAHNLQPHKILVIKSHEGIEKLSKYTNLYGASLAIITCIDENISWKRPNDLKSSIDIDGSIITTYMMLKATELSISSVWVGNFNSDLLKKDFNVPDNLEPISVLVLGYEEKSNNSSSPKRKDLHDIIVYETF